MSARKTSKENKKIKNNQLKLVSFWAVIGVFTVAFVVILIFLLIETRPFEDYDDIKEAKLLLVGRDLFEFEESEYYVYIYTSDSKNNIIDTFKAEEMKPIVFNYFNFVRQNSRKEKVISIYGFDVSNYNNQSCVGNEHSNLETSGFENFKVRARDLPILVRVSDGGLKSRHISITDVQKELQTATSVIQKTSVEGIIPRRKDELFA